MQISVLLDHSLLKKREFSKKPDDAIHFAVGRMNILWRGPKYLMGDDVIKMALYETDTYGQHSEPMQRMHASSI
jgi:hypothetical protein